MKTTAKVKKWGNSLAIRIPSAVAKDIGLFDDGRVQIISNGDSATIKLEHYKKADLKNLIAGITESNKHGEVEWGEPVGKEAW